MILRLIIYAIILAVVTSFLPLALIYRAKFAHTPEPRIHLVWHMDNQGRYKAQQANPFFEDGRASRLPVEHTVARMPAGLPTLGDEWFHTGLKSAYTGAVEGNYIDEFPPAVLSRDSGADGVAGTRDDGKPAMSRGLIERGRARFNIYCAVCHGQLGDGRGMVHQRAIMLAGDLNSGTIWVQPSDLASEVVVNQPVGQIFNTITNGIRTMPSYGAQIPPQDRWAIVAYVRTLQRAANGSLADVKDEGQKKLLLEQKDVLLKEIQAGKERDLIAAIKRKPEGERSDAQKRALPILEKPAAARTPQDQSALAALLLQIQSEEKK